MANYKISGNITLRSESNIVVKRKFITYGAGHNGVDQPIYNDDPPLNFDIEIGSIKGLIISVDRDVTLVTNNGEGEYDIVELKKESPVFYVSDSELGDNPFNNDVRSISLEPDGWEKIRLQIEVVYDPSYRRKMVDNNIDNIDNSDEDLKEVPTVGEVPATTNDDSSEKEDVF